MSQQMVVGYDAQVWELEIVNVHSIAFLNHLFDKLIDNTEAFPAAGASDYHRTFHRVYNIDKTVVPPLVMVESSPEIYGVFVFDQACFLHEGFVLIIEHILQQVVFQKTADSYSGSEQ